MVDNQLLLLDRIGWPAIKRIRQQRRMLQRSLKGKGKGKGICKVITQAINHDLGLKITIGFYQDTEHWWNVFADGMILDASADQFGQEAIVLVKPSDPEYAKYLLQGEKS